jgi:flagellar assembly factor FliW
LQDLKQASRKTNPREATTDQPTLQDLTMNIESQRFGTLDINEDELLSFPAGVIGFPTEQRFALVPHQGSGYIAWLQSVSTPGLAFPVVSAHAFGEMYPDVPVGAAAQEAGLEGSEEALAVMVVLCALNGQPATVNLLAPIVVNAATRRGAQVILEGTRFSTREFFALPDAARSKEPANGDQAATSAAE